MQFYGPGMHADTTDMISIRDFCQFSTKMSHAARIHVFDVSEQVRQKPAAQPPIMARGL